jgi:hypothetical protein
VGKEGKNTNTWPIVDCIALAWTVGPNDTDEHPFVFPFALPTLRFHRSVADASNSQRARFSYQIALP